VRKAGKRTKRGRRTIGFVLRKRCGGRRVEGGEQSLRAEVRGEQKKDLRRRGGEVQSGENNSRREQLEGKTKILKGKQRKKGEGWPEGKSTRKGNCELGGKKENESQGVRL